MQIAYSKYYVLLFLILPLITVGISWYIREEYFNKIEFSNNGENCESKIKRIMYSKYDLIGDTILYLLIVLPLLGLVEVISYCISTTNIDGALLHVVSLIMLMIIYGNLIITLRFFTRTIMACNSFLKFHYENGDFNREDSYNGINELSWNNFCDNISLTLLHGSVILLVFFFLLILSGLIFGFSVIEQDVDPLIGDLPLIGIDLLSESGLSDLPLYRIIPVLIVSVSIFAVVENILGYCKRKIKNLE